MTKDGKNPGAGTVPGNIQLIIYAGQVATLRQLV